MGLSHVNKENKCMLSTPSSPSFGHAFPKAPSPHNLPGPDSCFRPALNHFRHWIIRHQAAEPVRNPTRTLKPGCQVKTSRKTSYDQDRLCCR